MFKILAICLSLSLILGCKYEENEVAQNIDTFIQKEEIIRKEKEVEQRQEKEFEQDTNSFIQEEKE